MTEAILRLLAQRMLLQHEMVAPDLTVRSSNPAFWRLLETEPPVGAMGLTEVLPELFGMETEIEAMRRQGSGDITIPFVNRGEKCFDVTLLADPAVAPSLVLLLVDVTRQSQHQRNLLQSRNENALLRDRLAELNERIRDRSHSLEIAVSQRTVELRETRLEIIRRLARAAEIRDPQAGGHQARMSRYSAMIAQRIGLEEGQREIVYHASLLHDVGKIAIPDRILQKPGPLLAEEFEEIKRHTLQGAQLLGGSEWELMKAATTIALTHHERWDGGGYPAEIAGEAIPLFGRICAVADVFDALTMRRTYKAAWSVDEAAGYIAGQSGRAFDPAIAAAFADILPDIRCAQAQEDSKNVAVEELPGG